MGLKNSYTNFFTNKDGQKLYYETNYDPAKKLNSNDILIIFNNGLVCDSGHWGPQLTYFDSLGFNILTYYYRGHFESEGSNNIKQITFINLAHDIHDLIKYLGHSKNVLMGHSMGVNVTLEYARLFPGDIIAQVVISGTVIPPQDMMFDSNLFDLILPYVQLIQNKFPDLYNIIWKNSYKNSIVQRIVLNGGFNTTNVPLEYVEHYLKRIGELPPEIFMQLITEMQSHDVINDLHKIETPTLIIGGDNDKMIPNYFQTILKKFLKYSEIYIVKDGSHVPQIDFPIFVNNRIEYFLKKNTAL